LQRFFDALAVLENLLALLGLIPEVGRSGQRFELG